MFGFDEYIYGLIEEAKSPEEIKKILEYNFVQGKGVPQEVLDAVFNIDPTKKKSYTRWTLMQWDRFSEQIMSAIKDGKLKRMFDTFKSRAGSGLDLTNIDSFEKAMEYIPEADPILEKEGDPDSPENQFDVMFESDEWVVAVPKTYEASKKLGEGCRWCTAGYFGHGESYYENYSSYGPLWVNFDKRESEVAPANQKEYPYKRYQFLFEYQDWHGELMNSNDDRVDFEDVDMPSDAIEFYRGQNEEYANVIENGPSRNLSYEEYMDERDEMSTTVIALNHIDRYLVLAPTRNDDYNLDVSWQLYDEDDTSDSVFDGLYFSDADCVIERFDYQNDCQVIVLRDENGTPVLVYYDSVMNDRYGGWESSTNFNEIKCGDYYSFFIDDENMRFLFVERRSGKCIFLTRGRDDDEIDYETAEKIDNIIINRQIEQFIDTNQVHGFDGNFFEFIYVNRKHGLFYCSYDGNDYEMIVKSDFPPSGSDMFVPKLKEDGQTLFVDGRYWDYNLGDTKDNYTIIDELGDEKNLLLVRSKSGFNLYDSENKKLLFDKNKENIESFTTKYLEYLKINDYGLTWFFDIDHKKELPYKFESADMIDFYGQLWKCKQRDGTVVVCDFDHQYPLVYGPFVQIALLAKKYIAYRAQKDGLLNIIDSVQGGKIFKNDVKAILPFQRVYEGHWVSVSENGSEYDVYDLYTHSIVIRNAAAKTLRMIRDFDNHCIWEATMKDGRVSVMVDNKNLFGGPIDKVLGTFDSSTLIVEDNGKLFLANIDEQWNVDILPTKDGIDTSEAQFVEIVGGNSRFDGRRGLKFRVGTYIVEYYPDRNSPDSLLIFNTANPGVDNEADEQKIRKIFFPQMAAIQESFRNIYNKIKSL